MGSAAAEFTGVGPGIEAINSLAEGDLTGVGIAAAGVVAGKAKVAGEVVEKVASETIQSIDKLSQAASRIDRGGLTAAGRGLQKHGSRRDSAFPAAKGNPTAINEQGQKIVDGILNNPDSTTVIRNHARFGEVTEVRSPDGLGVRFGASGEFIGFLEPPL